MSQANSMRKRHRFNTRMTRIVLLISFLFFFGRFVYSSIGAWQHHQDKKERNSHRFLSPHRDNVKLLSVKIVMAVLSSQVCRVIQRSLTPFPGLA